MVTCSPIAARLFLRIGFKCVLDILLLLAHFLPLEASPCVNTYALASSSGSSGYPYPNVSSSSGNDSQSSQSRQSSPRPKPELPRYHPSVMPGSPVNNSVVPDKLSPYEVPQNPDLR